MLQIVSMKVWSEDEDGEITNKWYRIQNAEEVLDAELCSGDRLEIEGIGNLEILGVRYDHETGKNPYRSLEIICGLLTNEKK